MTSTLTGPWEITLPWKRPLMTANMRLHWAKKAALTKMIRHDTATLTRAKHVPACQRIHVTFNWQPDSVRRRDSDGPWPTVKPCLDGLVDAGVVADDDSTRVTSEVRIHPVVRGTSARVWLEVRRVE